MNQIFQYKLISISHQPVPIPITLNEQNEHKISLHLHLTFKQYAFLKSKVQGQTISAYNVFPANIFLPASKV